MTAVKTTRLTPESVAALSAEYTRRKAAGLINDDSMIQELCEDWGRMRAALKAAAGELSEAEDKFWVIHCNHPGIQCGRAQAEDKEFLATMSKRMKVAARSALTEVTP